MLGTKAQPVASQTQNKYLTLIDCNSGGGGGGGGGGGACSNPGHWIIKLFSCSNQLSMKFQLLIKTEMLKNKDISCFQTLICCIYPTNKC